MRVRYIYSACVVIETQDVRIVCDPWFTPGTYDGSWFQWPVVHDPINTIGPVDLIYVSHIHPDHYDSVFLREYKRRFPEAKLVIGKQSPPILEHKLTVDGFEFEAVEQLFVGSTHLWILPNKARVINVDTALVVRREDQSVVNLNDNPFDAQQMADIRQLCDRSRMLALLPYGGATAHPQTYMFPTKAELVEATQVKERHFLDIFHQYIDALGPSVIIPFAGTYWLGGALAELNRYRGMPDPVKAAAEVGERAVVLADGGKAYFDLESMSASEVRSEPYAQADVEAFLANLDFRGYAYEREIRPDPDHPLPLQPLLNTALRRARQRFPIEESCWVCICPVRLDSYLCFDVASGADCVVKPDAEALSDLLPRLEIYIDDRCLFGLLGRMYHWNNASLGSHYRYRRTPNVFRRDVFNFLDYLQV